MNQGSAMLGVAVMGTGPSQGLHRFRGGPVPLSYCPGSSLPAEVLTWLTGRLADLLGPRPPGVGGNPP